MGNILFFIDISLFVQTTEPSDFNNIPNLTMLDPEFTVNETHFSVIPYNSYVILDDFAFKNVNKKQAKADFLKVVNYILRHHKITLVLIVHNLFNTNLANDILYAPHIFLSYSNLGYLIMR